MARKKVKLAWVENDNLRAMSLKKRRIGLMKKVQEITILCDVRACMIMYSPNEAEPMVWPSVEAARDLLDHFFALPEAEQKKKETSLESYLTEKTNKMHEQLMKIKKKNMGYVIDQLMDQINHDRTIDDLNLSEIYELISFSKDTIMRCRKKLDFVQYPPLCDPPVPPFETQFEKFRVTTNDVFAGEGQGAERTQETDEAPQRINIGSLLENKSHYVMDQWFSASELPKTRTYQQLGMEMVSNNENLNPRSYHPYQGSSSNGNPNLEMEPVVPQEMTFQELLGLVSQPLQHQNLNNNLIMDMSQPRQYPFNFMSHESGVNNGDSQSRRSINTITTNDGVRQELHPNETTAGEVNADAKS